MDALCLAYGVVLCHHNKWTFKDSVLIAVTKMVGCLMTKVTLQSLLNTALEVIVLLIILAVKRLPEKKEEPQEEPQLEVISEQITVSSE